jgi:DNA repair protein RecN (Recombination protein N)
VIQKLHISNYALIEHLDFVPAELGLNIITGETGAGKSIIIGALGLILGERADTKVLMDKGSKCVVEVHFGLNSHKAIKKFLTHSDFDVSDPIIVRREISSSGRSRAFINDTPASLNHLKKLGVLLVDVHSQHQNHKLNDKSFQYKILDSFAENQELKSNYQDMFEERKILLEDLERLKIEQAELEKDIDYKSFLLDELLNANLEDLDPNQLEASLLLLENAEELRNVGFSAYTALDDKEESLTDQLSTIKAELIHLSNIHSGINSVVKSLDSAILELRALASDLRDIATESEVNPEKVELLNEQLHAYRSLVQKHKVMDVSQLIKLRDSIDQEIQSMSSNTERINSLETELEYTSEQCEQIAKEMSHKRFLAQADLQSKWKSDLVQLGMPNGEIMFSLSPSDELNQWGKDLLQIQFASNKGGTFEPLHKIASGGELSRIMLIVKSYLAKLSALPTMVLDEIDTGVSGETAKKVADMMSNLAKEHQLITITHLPQIAAKAHKHFYVYKDDGDVTHSHIMVLNQEQRVDEIAKMLSGENPTVTAKQNALELIRQ